MLAFLREGARHRPGGAWDIFIQAASVAAALYVLWIGALATLTGTLALHLGFERFGSWARAFTSQFHLDIAIFVAITFPIAFLTTTAGPWRKRLAWTDVALAALSMAVALYYVVLNDKFLHWSRGFSQPDFWDVVVGFTLVVLVVELARRSTSWGLTGLLVILLAFTMFGSWMPGPLRHDNYSVRYFIEMMTIQSDGIFGAPLEVAASYAFLFVLFGNFYNKAGGGQLFFDLASAVTGKMRGGAAKACVTASGLYGSVSGSPTADVATTGPLTIPIMIKQGVPPARAAAIEATSSSGGAMLPPVMGAVAFIMADITNIPYADIVAASWLPSILYYVAIYILVHNEAVRNGEPPMPADQIVPLITALQRGWRHLLPVGAMMWLLLDGYTPVYVAAGSTAAVIILSWFHRPSAIGPRRFVECCTETITQVVPLVGAVAAAGAITGAIEISALSGKFSLMISWLSGGYLIPTLLLSGLLLILLGMGMPTPAVYIMGAALLAPILSKFGLPQMQVHLFMLFYACLSAITPPVAVANFAAGAIAGVNPTSLGPYAVKLAIGGFVVPFFFLFNPGLTVQGSLGVILLACFFGTACTVFASFALHGMMALKDIALPLRLLLAASSVATIVPRLDVQIAATAVGSVILAFYYLRSRPAKVDVPA
ncbi:MAG TPA: TRAP transporter fused permease subunit [Burkholderiales bacterium]|nr:TRAP transporter fused permease subunit [Burkholderiales bacterium]